MKSIRRHLTFLMAGGFGLLLIACGSAVYVMTRVALLGEFDDGLRARALAIMAQSEQSSSGLQVEFSSAMKEEFSNAAAPQFYRISQTNGTVLAGTNSAALQPLQFGTQTSPAYWNLKLPGGEEGRAIGLKFLPKVEDEDRQQIKATEAILVVAVDRRPLDRTLATLAAVLGATGVLAMGVTVPLVKFAVKRGHAPLQTLGEQATGITANSLQVRFQTESLPEELQPITARLNDLLQRLEASFERERRFSADLAHELRTPLAELRAHAEVELQFSEGQTKDAYREPLNIAIQMEAIVTRLLDFARCENGNVRLQIEQLEIAPMIEEVWRPLAVQAAEKKLDVHFDVARDAKIETDGTMFRSILANLFSNAVTYTARGGRVNIAWREQARELSVSNTVQDLTAEDVPHLFERFWRKDKSRTGSEHNGLGLAVSRAFAVAIGLELTARMKDEKTLEIVLIRKT